MGGLKRLKPVAIPKYAQRPFTCTTLGCPDAAILVVPMNVHANRKIDPLGYASESGDEGRRHDGGDLEMRLCFRCIRTLATALPPGNRLAGARLRYPECDPEVRSAEELEYR